MTDTTDSGITDKWTRAGSVRLDAQLQGSDGEEYTGTVTLPIEANGPARRLTIEDDPDGPATVIARWRDGVPASVTVFPTEYLPEPMAEVLAANLRQVAAGSTLEMQSNITAQGASAEALRVLNLRRAADDHEDCPCMSPDRTRDIMRTLRRLSYASEAAAIQGGELGDLWSRITRAANDLYDSVNNELLGLGDVGRDAVLALARLHRGARARARIEGSIAVLDATPAVPEFAEVMQAHREQLVSDRADVEVAEHEAMAAVLAALATRAHR
jgi:hypothetical protein